MVGSASFANIAVTICAHRFKAPHSVGEIDVVQPLPATTIRGILLHPWTIHDCTRRYDSTASARGDPKSTDECGLGPFISGHGLVEPP